MANLLYRYRGLIFNLLLIGLSFVFIDVFRPFLQGNLDYQPQRVWSFVVLLLFALEMPAVLIKGSAIAQRQAAQPKSSDKKARTSLFALILLGALMKIVLDSVFIQVALAHLQLEIAIAWLIVAMSLKNILLLVFLFKPSNQKPHFLVELLADICLLFIANMAYVFLQEAFLSPLDLDNIRLLILLLLLISFLFLIFYLPYRLPYVMEDWEQQRSTWGRIGYTLSYFVLVFLFLRPTFYQSSALMAEVRAAHQDSSLYFQSAYGRLRTEQTKEICTWTELQALQLQGLSIDYLSPCWKDLRDLRYWDMRDNDLRKLYKLSNYPQLDTLLLENNNFNQLEFIPSTPHPLKALDLARNPLKELPQEMAQLSELRWLCLDYCTIDYFSKSGLAGLTDLEELSLQKAAGDQLPPFPIETGMLAQLERLQYSSRAEKIQIDTSALKRLPKLRTLDLSGQYLSQKQKQQLQRALPEVELLFEEEKSWEGR